MNDFSPCALAIFANLMKLPHSFCSCSLNVCFWECFWCAYMQVVHSKWLCIENIVMQIEIHCVVKSLPNVCRIGINANEMYVKFKFCEVQTNPVNRNINPNYIFSNGTQWNVKECWNESIQCRKCEANRQNCSNDALQNMKIMIQIRIHSLMFVHT